MARQASLILTAVLLSACNAFIEEENTNASATGGAGAVSDGDKGGEDGEDGEGGAGQAADNFHCGDGIVGPEEACDDGNNVPDDGCFDCELECGPLPEAYDRHGGRCYLYMSEPGVPLSKSAAAISCEDWGGALVTIGTGHEAGFLAQHLSATTVWTSGTLNDGQPSWPTEPWDDVAPFYASSAIQQGCIAFDGQFTALPCDDEQGYICERGM